MRPGGPRRNEMGLGGITGGQEEITGRGLGFLTPSLPQPPALGQVSALPLPHH